MCGHRLIMGLLSSAFLPRSICVLTAKTCRNGRKLPIRHRYCVRVRQHQHPLGHFVPRRSTLGLSKTSFVAHAEEPAGLQEKD